jgi:hypothetical protein
LSRVKLVALLVIELMDVLAMSANGVSVMSLHAVVHSILRGEDTPRRTSRHHINKDQQPQVSHVF